MTDWRDLASAAGDALMASSIRYTPDPYAKKDTVADTNHMTHLYASTACQHGLHDRCRQACKYCEATCLCPCHRLASIDEVAGLYADQAKAGMTSREVLEHRE